MPQGDAIPPPAPLGVARSSVRTLLGRRVVRDGLWIAGGQAVAFLAILVGIRLLTGLLEPAVFGQVALIAGLGTLARDVLCSPVLAGILRFYHDADRDDRVGDLIRAAGSILRRRIFILTALLVVGGAAFAAARGNWTIAAGFAAGAFVAGAETQRGFEGNLLNASRGQRAFAIRNALDAIARPVAAVLLIVLFGAHAALALLGYAVGTTAVLVTTRRWRLEGRPSTPSPERDAWDGRLAASLATYGRPLVPMALLGWVLALGDRYFIAGLASAESVGLYAAVYGLASQPFLVLSTVTTSTLRPLLFDAVARGDRAKERRLIAAWLAAIAAGGGIGWLLLALLREPIVHLLLSRTYWAAATYVPFLAAAYLFTALQQVVEGILFARGRTRRLLPIQAAGAIVALGGYFVLIPRLGALGAAVATMASCLVSALVAAMMAILPSRPDSGTPERQSEGCP